MSSQSKTICAIVVTYNRKHLLLECLNAIKNQTHSPHALYIIDNYSNDGTYELLLENGYVDEHSNIESDFLHNSSIEQNNIKYFYYNTNKNIGGAGGFNIGLKKAYQYGYDYFWIMDDDTIPNENALEILCKNVGMVEKKNIPIGFACSKVLHTDGNVHIMNIPIIHSIYCNDTLPFNSMDDDRVLISYSCSFVSVLITQEAITKCGLPYKEYFIWHDDVEYTSRLSDNGFIGIYSLESHVTHKTPFNYGANIITASINDLWKYRYGIRNSMHALKTTNLKRYILMLVKKIFIESLYIYKHRENHKFRYTFMHLQSTLKSVLFNPKKEYPNDQ